MKYIIPILTLLLFLYGLFITSATLLSMGIGFYTPILTIATLTGLIVSLFNRRIGWTIIFIITIGWLLRYFEHASYLIFYDFLNIGRWFLVAIPIILAFSLFGLIYKEKKGFIKKPFNSKFLGLALIVFLSIGLLSFIWKPHIDEYNCWYYFNENTNDFKITFAITPKQKFEASSNSAELKEIIKNDGMTYEFREGYYCPETKVKIITQFKRIIGLKILGFRNTEINKVVKFNNPVKIDIKTINGDSQILQPEFNIGN